MTNPNESEFNKKNMIVDKEGRVIPQYYDAVNEVFHPNTGGEPLVASGTPENPYQPDFVSKAMIVDKKGRPIPQYYDVDNEWFVPVTFDTSGGGGGGGGTPIIGVRTVNLKAPDLAGNVNTDFHIIDPIGPDVPPSGYPVGSTEFYMDYDPANYAQYIADNPSMAQLQAGEICVRTFRNNGFSYQQVDNVKNGLFDASYVRVNIDASNWGELSAVGASGGSGTPGPQGPQGEQGPKGDKGDTGQQGPQGPKGDKGDKGDVGEQGLPGVDGIDGDKGDKGDTGPQGPAGPKGDDGAQGPKGDKGDKGDTGDVGPQGTQGIQGDKGDTGLEGPMGLPGTVINDSILPTTPPTNFQRGLTITSPRAHQNDEVYTAWRDWVIATSGANINYGSPFYVRIETTRSDYPITTQVIKIIVPSVGVNGYSEVMQITRMALTETGAFNTPGVQMNTMRGSGSPQGKVSALIGNSYYDYTNKVMYIKTEEGPNDPQTSGWISLNELTELLVDDVTVKLVNGAVSAPAVPVQNDNVTTQTPPTTFTNEHTVTIVQDNGFRSLLESLTGGSLTDLTTNFVVNTYKKPTSSGYYKYYQYIDVYIGDVFTTPNLAARIYRNSNESNNWGYSDRITIEPIQRITNTPLIPIDYALAGSTVHDVRIDMDYVAIKGDDGNPITNMWTEVRSVDVRERYDISLLPRDYRLGVSESYLASSNDGYPALLSAMNSFFGWNVTSGDVVFYTRTNRNSQGEVLQTVDIYFTKLHAGRKFGTMSRASSTSQSFFGAWRGETVIHYGLEQPSGTQYGMKGNLYINAVTGIMYRMSNASNNVPTWDGWNPITTAVLNSISEAIPEDEDSVYSAELTNTLIGDINQRIINLDTTLSGELNTHMMTMGLDDNAGHVQADGQSIKSANGIISAKSNLNRIWESDPIPANATTWTVDFSDEPDLTDLNNYDFEIYDDGVLIFGNPITHVVNNANKTVTFTPTTPMPRAFTLTCIGRGMEFE